jgi:hypothetical protein
VSDFKPAAVDELSEQLSGGFFGASLELQLTCGRDHLPVTLTVKEFAPRCDGAALISTIDPKSRDGVASFQYKYPPPIAIQSGQANTVEQYRKHFMALFEQDTSTLNLCPQKSCEILNPILSAICGYYQSLGPLKNVS